MKKLLCKGLTFLLMIGIFLGLLPAITLSAAAETVDYSLVLTSTGELRAGTDGPTYLSPAIQYNSAKKTLTLSGFEFSTTANNALLLELPVTIEVIGENKISCAAANRDTDSSCVKSNSDITITGSGKLTVQGSDMMAGGSYALESTAGMTISGAVTVEAYTGSMGTADSLNGCFGIFATGQLSILDGATVRAASGANGLHSYAVRAGNGMTVTNSTLTAASEMAQNWSAGIYVNKGVFSATNSDVVAHAGSGAQNSWGIKATDGIGISGGMMSCSGQTYGIYTDKSLCVTSCDLMAAGGIAALAGRFDPTADCFVRTSAVGTWGHAYQGETYVELRFHTHTYDKTDWVGNDDAHWYSCTASDCLESDPFYFDGYAAHTPQTDDGNCTTAVLCSICKKEVVAVESHDWSDTPVNDTVGGGHYYTCENDCTIRKPEAHSYQEVVKEECLASEASYTEPAWYKKSCICGAMDETQLFPHGDVLTDSVPPAAQIKVGTTTWNDFAATQAPEFFISVKTQIEMTAADAESGVKSVEYLISEEEFTDAAQITDTWSALAAEEKVYIENSGTYYIYLRVTDVQGNVTIVRSDAIVFDDVPPVISGVEAEKTYYVSQLATVEDAYLDTVTLNGVTASASQLLEGNVDATYTLVAVDKAGNRAELTVTMQPVAALAAPMTGIDESNVTSDDIPAIGEAEGALAQLDMTHATQEDIAAVETQEALCDALKDRVAEAAAAAQEAYAPVAHLTEDNVQPSDRTALKEAKADLEAALETYSGNYTQAQTEKIEEQIDYIEKLLALIDREVTPTGDSSNLAFWFVLSAFALTLCSLAVLLLRRKRSA